MRFLSVLTLFLVLLFSHLVRAVEKPQLFGVQKSASAISVSPRGDRMVVDDDKTNGFQMWDVASKRVLWKSDDYFLCFSNDKDEDEDYEILAPTDIVMVARGAHLVDGKLVDLEGVKLEMIDARTGEFRYGLGLGEQPAEDEGEEFLDCGFSKDGLQFRVAMKNHLRLYNLVQGGYLLPLVPWTGIEAQNGLKDAAFIPGKEQLIAYDEGGLMLLDATNGAFIKRLAGDPALQARPDNDIFLDVSPDNFFFIENFYGEPNDHANDSRICRFSDGKLLWRAVNWPALSPDGKLAYVSTPSGLEVFDSHTGHKIKSLAGLTSEAFTPSPDGNYLYEARDGKIWRWRAL